MSFGASPGPAYGPGETLDIDVHMGHRHCPAQKTDLSPGTAGAVAVSREVLAGDVNELLGWSIVEDAGVAAAAEIRLHDGSGPTGEVLAVVKLPAGGSSFVFLSSIGVAVNTGRIFVAVMAGSVEGVIYWR